MRAVQEASEARLRGLMNNLAAELYGLPPEDRAAAWNRAQGYLRDGLLKRRSSYAEVASPERGATMSEERHALSTSAREIAISPVDSADVEAIRSAAIGYPETA